MREPYDFDEEDDFEEDPFVEELIHYIARRIDYEESLPCVVNRKQEDLTLYIYELLKESVCGEDTTIRCKLHSPSKSMGVVTIISRKLLIKDAHTFGEALNLAGNFEVTTKTDGTVDLDFMVYGLVDFYRGDMI